MPRQTTKASNMALFASTSATGTQSLTQLYRIQSLSYNLAIEKETVNQYGNTAPISRIQVNPPTVGLDFSYYIAGVNNEAALGFHVGGTQSILKNILDLTRDEQNYFVFIAPDGTDANGLSGADGKVKSFGNSVINSFSIEAAVGSFPTASVSVTASNIVGHLDGVAEQIPSIDISTGIRITGVNFTIPPIETNAGTTQPKVIRPGDTLLTLTSCTGLFHDISTACVQSVSLSVNLNREPINCLGSRFPRKREVTYPIEATLQLEVLSNDIISGDLSTFQCLSGAYNADISFRENVCNGTGSNSMGISIKNIFFDGQSWATSFGALGETLTLNYTAFIGDSGDSTNGIMISGVTYS